MEATGHGPFEEATRLINGGIRRRDRVPAATRLENLIEFHVEFDWDCIEKEHAIAGAPIRTLGLCA